MLSQSPPTGWTVIATRRLGGGGQRSRLGCIPPTPQPFPGSGCGGGGQAWEHRKRSGNGHDVGGGVGVGVGGGGIDPEFVRQSTKDAVGLVHVSAYANATRVVGRGGGGIE